jgi:dihydrofolate reductase
MGPEHRRTLPSRVPRSEMIGLAMRIVIIEFMSLDGVVQAPGGPEEDTDGGFANGGWSMPYFDEKSMGAAIDEVMQSTEALLFGRRTWQTMAAAWPDRAGDPFADRMNEIPKYVASRTLTQDDLHWSNSTLLPADALEAVRRLRATEGGDLQDHGKSESRPNAGGGRPRRRIPPDDRAHRARWRQAPVPR